MDEKTEYQKGIDYAILTYEAKLDLTAVYSLIRNQASEDFLAGYRHFALSKRHKE